MPRYSSPSNTPPAQGVVDRHTFLLPPGCHVTAEVHNPGVLHPFMYRTWPSSSIPRMSLFTSLLLNLLFDGVHHLEIFFSFKLSSSHTDFLGLVNGCTAVIGVVMSIFFLSTQQLSDSYVSPIVGPASTISYLLHVYNV